MWTRLWNFMVRQVKLNRFLHPNDLPQRIFWYLIRQLDWMESKVGYFQFFKSTFRSKINLIILKMIFVLEYQIRRTTFIKIIFNFSQFWQTLFSKFMPYFCWLSGKSWCQISKKWMYRVDQWSKLILQLNAQFSNPILKGVYYVCC